MKSVTKKILFALIVAVMGNISVANAQKLVVWKADQTKVTYDLEEKPVTTFQGANLVITTDKMTVSYPLKDLLRYTFEEVVSSVDTPAANHGIIVRQSDNDMTFVNLATGANIQVYDSSGQLLQSSVAEGMEPVTLSFGERPKGVYIIKVDDVSYKFLRK